MSPRAICRLLFIMCGVLVGCRPTILYVGDPAQRSTLPDPALFETELERGIRSEGYRLEIEWFDGVRLSELPIEERIRASAPDRVALSPYVSLLSDELISTFPELPFVYFDQTADESISNPETEGSPSSHTRIWFSPDRALHEAAQVVVSWANRVDGRSIVVVVGEGEAQPVDAAQLFISALRAAEIEFRELLIERRAGREAVRSHVQSISLEESTLVALFVSGEVGALVVEFLQNEPVGLFLFGADASASPFKVIASVHNDVISGLTDGVSGGPGSVRVDSQLIVNDRVR